MHFRWPLLRLVLLVALFGAGGSALRGDVISVPFDYPLIQEAIDAAVDGDEIVVESGTYHEAIDFKGKAIYLHSARSRVMTIIDADGLDASVVSCVSGEGRDTILEGFTIVGGAGTEVDGHRYGGGMYNLSSSPTVVNCVFAEHGSSNISSGGGMYNENSSPWVEDCIFERNWVGGTGGGMANIGSSPIVLDCLFDQNSASWGGGMSIDDFSSPVLRNCIFSRHYDTNRAINIGGAIISYATSPLEISDCIFVENVAIEGGAIASFRNVLTITRCSFISNNGGNGGGAIYDQQSTVVMSDCLFEGNYATRSREDGTGGAIHFELTSAEFKRCTFNDNHAWSDGGALYASRGEIEIHDCSFTGNSAGDRGSWNGGGAVMLVDVAKALVRNSFFEENRSDQGGGAIFNGGFELTVAACEFVNNEAGESGGAINGYSYSGPNLILQNSRFSGNTAVESGGALHNYKILSGPVVNCVFDGNEAEMGGAMYSLDDDWSLVNCTLVGNSAAEGGALYNWLARTSPVIANCVFADNTATVSGDHLFNYDGAEPKIGYSNIGGSGGSGANWDVTLGMDSGGNVDANPMFVDGVAGDFRLRSGSFCLDAGANFVLPDGVDVDLDGNARLVDDPFITDTGLGDDLPVVDMGAFEFQAVVGPVLSVLPEPLIAGADAVFFLSNARFETETFLVYSLSGVGRTFVPAINVALDLENPRRFGGSLYTDGNGSAGYVVEVPEKARGLAIWFQAVQLNLKTGVVATRVE